MAATSYIQPDELPYDPNDEDENDLDGQPSPEAQEDQSNQQMLQDSGGYPGFVPGMVGVTPEMMSEPAPLPMSAPTDTMGRSTGVPPPPPNWLQRTAQSLKLSQPPSNTPIDTGLPSYPDAAKAVAKLYNQFPQRQAPNWLERVAASALGAAAGYSNAARRSAPIDIKSATEPILYPGYDQKVAQWQSQLIPAEKNLEVAGQQAALGLKSQQIGAESLVKGSQAYMYQQRGDYYHNLNPSRLVTVTPEMETATGGKVHANTQIPASVAARIYDDIIKGNSNQMTVTDADMAKRLGKNVGDMVPNSIYQAGVTAGNRAPNESAVKDNQLRADYASAVGKEPAAVSDAEMNAARRMFSTNDDLVRTSLRKFIYEKKRLPNPAEERSITLQAIEQGGAARRAPVSGELPVVAPPSGPVQGATKLVNGVPYQFDGTVWRKQAQPGGNQ
jgi:hypothetical protein